MQKHIYNSMKMADILEYYNKNIQDCYIKTKKIKPKTMLREIKEVLYQWGIYTMFVKTLLSKSYFCLNSFVVSIQSQLKCQHIFVGSDMVILKCRRNLKGNAVGVLMLPGLRSVIK